MWRGWRGLGYFWSDVGAGGGLSSSVFCTGGGIGGGLSGVSFCRRGEAGESLAGRSFGRGFEDGGALAGSGFGTGGRPAEVFSEKGPGWARGDGGGLADTDTGSGSDADGALAYMQFCWTSGSDEGSGEQGCLQGCRGRRILWVLGEEMFLGERGDEFVRDVRMKV